MPGSPHNSVTTRLIQRWALMPTCSHAARGGKKKAEMNLRTMSEYVLGLSG